MEEIGQEKVKVEEGVSGEEVGEAVKKALEKEHSTVKQETEAMRSQLKDIRNILNLLTLLAAAAAILAAAALITAIIAHLRGRRR